MATSLLPNNNKERNTNDTQRTEFTKQTYETEAKRLGMLDDHKPLTAYQTQLLQTIASIDAAPVAIKPCGTQRSDEEVAASVAIHKRVNPGYVETPYRATSQMAFEYKPPPDFTTAFLKKDSDCGFQKYAAEAILKHVDLKKTSH